MNKTLPIKNRKDLDNFRTFYKIQKPNTRNQLMITLGLNTGLRISDMLTISWNDVYDFDSKCIRSHLNLSEIKTGKSTSIFINTALRATIVDHLDNIGEMNGDDLLFISQKHSPLSRSQAYRIVHNAAKGCNIEGVIGCHSMRKTFAYYAYKQGISPTLLMALLNHSSFDITRRYIGIEQDEKDIVYKNLYR